MFLLCPRARSYCQCLVVICVCWTLLSWNAMDQYAKCFGDRTCFIGVRVLLAFFEIYARIFL